MQHLQKYLESGSTNLAQYTASIMLITQRGKMQRCKNSMLIFKDSEHEASHPSFSRTKRWLMDVTVASCFWSSADNRSRTSWIFSLSFLRLAMARWELSELSSSALRAARCFEISTSYLLRGT